MRTYIQDVWCGLATPAQQHLPACTCAGEMGTSFFSFPNDYKDCMNKVKAIVNNSPQVRATSACTLYMQHQPWGYVGALHKRNPCAGENWREAES